MKLSRKSIFINIENNNIDDIFNFKKELVKRNSKEYSKKYYKENKNKYKKIDELKKDEESKLSSKIVKIEVADENNKFILEI